MERDQLSYLPKIILHDILTRLPEEDAVRTSVLSKKWAQTWYTFPILSFSDMKFVGRRVHYLVNSSNITPFLDNVERTLLRFHNQGLAIKHFKLSVRSFDLYHVSKYVDLWLKLAIESGIEVLELHRSRSRCSQRYILPTGIFEAKSLSKLALMGRIQVDLSFMNHSMKFFSLQVLKLESVCLGDEHALKHFISCCPLIEYITLIECGFPDDKGYLHDFESLSMCGLPKLKGFYVDGIQEVYVDCPCLENLHYSPSSDPSEKIELIGFSKCKNLRELCIQSLRSTIITNKWFYELFANFPFLESLKLGHCTMSKRIVISSVQLKMLELSSCFDLKEVNIDAPNLLSCKYCDRKCALKSISFLRCSSKLKVDVWIYIYNIDFCNFREFIQNFTPKIALASITLSIHPPTVSIK